MASVVPLRERQAEAARQEILDALIDHLETDYPEDISLQQVAADAGVSIRTLYRHFATREALFAAAGPRIYERLELPTAVAGPHDIVPSFLRASGVLSRHPKLARSMLRSSLGRLARNPSRGRRVHDVMDAVSELTSHLDDGEARRRAAVIAYLCSAASHVTISDEAAMAADDARAAVAWALTTLIDALRSEQAQVADTRQPRRPGGGK